MSLLDDETLKEIGRFATEFTTLDEVITYVAEEILECAERKTAEQITANAGTLGRKLELFKTVSKQLAATYALTESQPYRLLSTQIRAAKPLVGHRNTVLHGSLTIKRGQPPIIQAKKETMELTQQRLSELRGQIDLSIEKLSSAYFDFMDAVHEARDK